MAAITLTTAIDIPQRCLLLMTMLIPLLQATCDFPPYLQTTTNQRDWRTHIKSQFSEFTQTVVVDGSLMTTSPNDGTPFERTCLDQVPGDKFVVSHSEQGQRPQYLCIQFIKRSDNVIQLKTSAISSEVFNICEGDLTLDPWIMVDRAHVLSDGEVCPLVGGFGLLLYDKETYSAVCNAYSDNAWIDSECVQGQGLYFNFRYSRCIPNVMMSRTQRTVCVTSWVEEKYTFALLRHNKYPYMWVLRYPTDDVQTSFNGYLMKELYAPMDAHVSSTNMYVQMTTVPNVPQPVTSLCIDQSEACSYWNRPCSSGDDMALTCPRTCGLCNVTRPAECSFQDVWHGDWIDASHGDRVAATFETDQLRVYFNRINQEFNCIRWDDHTGPVEKFTTYGMLVTAYDNGCRPTYSCLRVVHTEQSAVMFLQLSTERSWPLTDSVTQPVNCNAFEWEGDGETLIDNRYRSKHYKLLYSKSLDTGKMCNIPLQNVFNYSVSVSDGTECQGGLIVSSDRTSFSVNITSCPRTQLVRSVPTIQHCVESLRFFSSEQILVTRTAQEPYQMQCWVFPKKSRDTFYLVEVAHCNENTKKRISKGHLTPLLTFSRGGPHTTVPGENLSPTPPVKDNTFSGENSVMDPTATSANDSIKKDTNSTTRPGTNPAAYASPVVVVAAIVFFVIFQIPCMCKNS